MKRTEAMDILNGIPLEEVREMASKARRARFGEGVDTCGIISARTGGCRENCAFCAQSGTLEPTAMTSDELVSAHVTATRAGIGRFSAVASGQDLQGEGFQIICEMARRGEDLCPLCASLGILTMDSLERLRDAGVSRYHHNLESSADFFPRICTTHSWDQRAMTVRRAKIAGLSVCSGGIFGIGETDEDRVDLAFTLRELQVDSIPLNFYVPVPAASVVPEHLSGEKKLRIIALFSLVNPGREIRVCAGRSSLGEMETCIFDFGATGIMTGDLLTTGGSSLDDDVLLIGKAGYEA